MCEKNEGGSILKIREIISEGFDRMLLTLTQRVANMGALDVDSQKEKLSELIFEFEAAAKRCWQVFSRRTRDIGTDYMIGKD